MRPKITPATVLSALALFFALGGTAIAARHYLITSASQIKPSVLRKLHGAAGTPGPVGATGASGPQGPAGPSSLSALTEAVGPTNIVLAGGVEGSAATCPTGQHAVSGGGFALVGSGALNDSQMSEDHQSWFVITHNEGVNAGSIKAVAFCAGAGQAIAAGSPRAAHDRVVREMGRFVARLASATQGR